MTCRYSATPGPFTREAGFLGYNEICSELGEGGWEERWEPCHRAPYMVKRDKWVSFDNEQSVKLKADLAWDQRLAGVMVWSIETDDFQGLLLVCSLFSIASVIDWSQMPVTRDT